MVDLRDIHYFDFFDGVCVHLCALVGTTPGEHACALCFRFFYPAMVIFPLVGMRASPGQEKGMADKESWFLDPSAFGARVVCSR